MHGLQSTRQYFHIPFHLMGSPSQRKKTFFFLDLHFSANDCSISLCIRALTLLEEKKKFHGTKLSLKHLSHMNMPI